MKDRPGMGEADFLADEDPDAIWRALHLANSQRTRRANTLAFGLPGALLAGAGVCLAVGAPPAAAMVLPVAAVAVCFVAPMVQVANGRRCSAQYEQALLESGRRGNVRVIPRLVSFRATFSSLHAEIDSVLSGPLPTVASDPDRLAALNFVVPLSTLLEPACKTRRLKPDGAPLLSAAVEALKHVGDRRDLARLRQLASWERTTEEGRALTRQGEDAISAIEARLAREAAGATLLRPAEPGAEALLRPAEGDDTRLLRPAEDGGEQGNEVRG